ncbi:hypothetical protein BDZ85DRAFT_266853 [Elsinoe ampelina]|uniref:Uncharacterized protein n=1 Tax=Elsinoe ampelina TaxID=302913 RepID=A0A6A6G4C8_9PEZI|nr:hypothetical protein BDZ85DRAFT_266853 [Elsinoe ampelina]
MRAMNGRLESRGVCLASSGSCAVWCGACAWLSLGKSRAEMFLVMEAWVGDRRRWG